jgi:putative ABC transport system ATP-binding protein
VNDERSASLLSARHVRRAHRTAWGVVPVLEDVSLELRAGELALLVGPSGSGKTTLLSVLSGLMRPDAGEVTLAGTRIDALGEAAIAAVRRRSVGFVFQSFQLFEALSACDNVAEVLALRGQRFGSARETARALLADVGLADRAHHLPAQLSAGQKQRVAIARAFAGDPPVVFADEPTAALDPPTARDIMRRFREQVRGSRCALVVTHDEKLRDFADRALRLDSGRLEDVS